MGWNEAYTIYEATVVGAYDLGKLDRELLDVLMEPYRDTNPDHGGGVGLRSKDGKSADEIAVEVFGLKMPPEPGVPQSDYSRMAEWTQEERDRAGAWEDWHDACAEVFRQVTDHYGWA